MGRVRAGIEDTGQQGVGNAGGREIGVDSRECREWEEWEGERESKVGSKAYTGGGAGPMVALISVSTSRRRWAGVVGGGGWARMGGATPGGPVRLGAPEVEAPGVGPA